MNNQQTKKKNQINLLDNYDYNHDYNALVDSII